MDRTSPAACAAIKSHLLQFAPRVGTHMKACLRLLAFVLVVGFAGAAAAQEQVKLFKIITAKDEIVIGLTGDELRKLGPAPDLDNLAQWLASSGHITVWQYAVGR